ncbi:amino acid--[acyl-carrier-protein] ligase [Smaragdicoccus niigatensis]|uniref:amino acid--[acyl-carrier-protein] ligase n=1 Tax=Smaragdicoccus niigatensis TaxID=359359 RepID=UPI00036EDA4D|nr:amino acid--[acyl-carrier-protein] ligase [Smaragdicoccus niigatensis]
MNDLEQARRTFRDELIESGLLVGLGGNGLYAQSADFALIVAGITRLVETTGADGGSSGLSPRRLRFPPVFPRQAFEKTDYLASFPHLTGAVSTFTGDNEEHARMLAGREAGQSWDSWLTPAETMLVPAACHPVYATLAGVLPPGGELIEVAGHCFRHEPAVDPARMQAFQMHEFVRVGSPVQAQDHRTEWIDRAEALLTSLGLDAEAVGANDPFFGRAGRLLASNQRRQNLKTELVVRLYGELDDGTAVASCNYHQDHFGTAFGITLTDGDVAHSACVGFGLERIALALLRTHGLDASAWPTSVRALLSL